jgi:hypothetical protein
VFVVNHAGAASRLGLKEKDTCNFVCNGLVFNSAWYDVELAVKQLYDVIVAVYCVRSMKVGRLSLPWSLAGDGPEKCFSGSETAILCGLGFVNIENDAVQKRTLLRTRWRATQTGGFRLIGEAAPPTVRPALDLSNDTVQRELAELLA